MEEKIINAYPYEIDADDVDSMAEITPCDDVTSAETEAAPEAETETETAYESSTESEAAETAEAAAEEEEPEAAEEPQGSAPGTDAEETDAITDREEADRKYVSETVTRIYSELKDIHKLYHNEFAGRLRSMQDKLDYYKKLEEGRVYDGILGELARIYVINEDLPEQAALDPKLSRNIRYLLMDIEDLLSVYGMEAVRSETGNRRDPKHCQVSNRIETTDPGLHDTVAKSHRTGFRIGNRNVIKEKVDIYYCIADKSSNEAEAEMETQEVE